MFDVFRWVCLLSYFMSLFHFFLLFQGLCLKVQPHQQRVPRSQRGGEVIEPLVSSQWFVKTEGMGAKALAAVEEKDIQILPER